MNWKGVAALASALLCVSCGPSRPSAPNHEESQARTIEGGCYDEAGEDFVEPDPARALFVVVDQSTGLDQHLRETLKDNVERLLKPGTAYSIYTFSAYSKGHYPTPIASGALEAPVPEEDRPDLSVRRLHRLDQCLSRRQKQVAMSVEGVLDEATGAASSEFSNSEIMASLKQISDAVRRSTAKEKFVLLVSDLIEHSSSTSFYRKKQVRSIDPEAELGKAEANHLLADFDGAQMAVIGAGLLSPESGAEATRDTATLDKLHSFWEGWFEASNARIVDYGQPDLVQPLSWKRDRRRG